VPDADPERQRRLEHVERAIEAAIIAAILDSVTGPTQRGAIAAECERKPAVVEPKRHMAEIHGKPLLGPARRATASSRDRAGEGKADDLLGGEDQLTGSRTRLPAGSARKADDARHKIGLLSFIFLVNRLFL